jgi:hypothetical protein
MNKLIKFDDNTKMVVQTETNKIKTLIILYQLSTHSTDIIKINSFIIHQQTNTNRINKGQKDQNHKQNQNPKKIKSNTDFHLLMFTA